MSTNKQQHTDALKMKPINYLSIPVVTTFLIIGALNNAQASVNQENIKVENISTEQLVLDVLSHSESAISNIRVNPEAAKISINEAIATIKILESHYAKHTLVDLKKDGKTTTATSYHHYYPMVDMTLLKDLHNLPTLNYKLSNGILYQGNTNKLAEEKHLYFDYTFAKASLITAREAIDADDKLETLANLRRTFEAVYVNPDFKVSSVNQ